MTMRSLYFASVILLTTSVGGAVAQAQSQCDTARPHTDYTGCEFFGKTMDGADFSKSDFSGANLMNFKCRRCVFDGATMHKSDMKWSDFSDSSFVDTDLSEADLFHTRFDYATLTGANLSDSFQFGTDLNYVKADKAIFAGAFMKDIIMEEASFQHSDFSGVNMIGGYILGSDFRWSNLRHMEMTAASAEEVKFSGSDLSGTVLRGARLIETQFIGANLQDVDFGNALFEATDFRDALNVPETIQGKIGPDGLAN